MTTTTSTPETPAGPSAKQAQLDAIEQSGWGQPFRLPQPRNAAFWVYALGVGIGLITLLRYFGANPGFYAPALTTGVLMFSLYLVPWLLLLSHHNRYTAQPSRLLASAFVWGGTAATFWISLPANNALLEIWTKIGGTDFADRWAAGLTAPINEEFSKALGLILLIGLAPKLVRSAYDGFIIGAFIGLGFQVAEDILYAYNAATQTFGVGQVGAALKIFVFRGLAGIVSHALFSAIFCAGLMWLLGRVPGDRKPLRGILTMLMAMVFHFGWDDSRGLGANNPALTLVLPFVFAAIELPALFYVLRRAATTERRWTRAILTPELGTGAVDPPLLQAVSGLRKDRRQYAKRLHNRRQARHLISGAQDLANAIADAHGAETPEVDHARAEIRRLGQPG
ncbi:MAG: PrsW family intramembrane metalloprotease [Hamadaea sp.]|nr:PrsW family intramembrane metalloprotease [Hamadaea sp.]